MTIRYFFVCRSRLHFGSIPFGDEPPRHLANSVAANPAVTMRLSAGRVVLLAWLVPVSVACSPDCSGDEIFVGNSLDVQRAAFISGPGAPEGRIPPQVKVRGWTFVLDGNFERAAPDDLFDGAAAELVSASSDGVFLTDATLEIRTASGSTVVYVGPVDCS